MLSQAIGLGRLVIAAILTLFLYLAAQARRAFAHLKPRAARRGAAKRLLDQLREEVGKAIRDPHRYGNRHTRRTMDSLYFRHRSRGLPLMRWDSVKGAFVSAARRRIHRAPRELRDVLKLRAVRRRMLRAKWLRRAVNLDAKKRRRQLALLQSAIGALQELRRSAEAAGISLDNLAVAGKLFYDKLNQRLLEGDENGDLRLVGEGPLESLVPTPIKGLSRAA